MKTFSKWFFGTLIVLLIVFFSGPKPSKPGFKSPEIVLPATLAELEKQINESEKTVKGIKQDNEARIVWADTSKREKTKIAFLYLHGFSASQGEGIPVHRDIAGKYNANIYLSRLSEHGIDRGDSTMINLTADNYEASAERALTIAEKIGENVVVIGTSGGGALALFLAARHPEIKALVLYSPCVKLFDSKAELLAGPWGLQIGRKATGGKSRNYPAEGDLHARYWMLSYRIEGLVAFQNFLRYSMVPYYFKKVTCPVFLGYFYKNDEIQDKTVSVPAMLKMYDSIGTPLNLKEKIAFPEAGAHVIASSIRSKDWQNVEKETEKFLDEIVKL